MKNYVATLPHCSLFVPVYQEYIFGVMTVVHVIIMSL